MIWIFLILILILIIFIYFYFKDRFWYNLDYYLKEDKYFINSKYLSKNLFYETELKPHLKTFYEKYYYPKINLNFQIFPNYKLIYYLDKTLKGCILNSKMNINIFGKTYSTNFVDYAVVKPEERNKNIMRCLMNETSVLSNEWNTDFVNFRIDGKPLSSGLNYVLKSEYLLIDKIKVLNPLKIKDFKGIKIDYLNLEEIKTNNFKIQGLIQKNHFEIKFIHFYKNNLDELIISLKNLLKKYKTIGFDNIGNNLILSKTFSTKKSHNIYHYMLKYKKEIIPENFYT